MDISEIRESILGKERRTVEVSLPAEVYEKALALFAAKDLQPSEGFAAAISIGVGDMENPPSDPEEESWFKRYNRLEGTYIGLNDKAYRLALDSERMELSRNGWMVENEALRKRVIALTEDVRRLGGALPQLLPDEAPAPAPPAELEAPAFLEDDASPSGPSLWDKLRGRG